MRAFLKLLRLSFLWRIGFSGQPTTLRKVFRSSEFLDTSIVHVLLKILEQVKVIPIDDLLQEIQNHLMKKVHVDFIYYALDWLFLLSLVKIEEGKVYYENKEIDSA